MARPIELEFGSVLREGDNGEQEPVEVSTCLSAVAVDGPCLWLAGDEAVSVERLTTQDGTSYAQHASFPLTDYLSLPEGGKEEVDIEGLACDGGYLWLVGSHSARRKQLKKDKGLDDFARVMPSPNRHVLARIPRTQADGVPTLAASSPEGLVPAMLGGPDGSPLTRALRPRPDTLEGSDPHLGRFLDIPCKENGFDIEGLAVRGEQVLLGLRGPVLRGWACLLGLRVTAKDDDSHTLQLTPVTDDGRDYVKYFLRLDELGVRELAWHGEDLLILAGPTMGLDGPVRLYRWASAAAALQARSDQLVPADVLTQVLEVPFDEDKHRDHAEGIALLPTDGGGACLLVVYDSPAIQRQPRDDTVTADVFPLQV